MKYLISFIAVIVLFVATAKAKPDQTKQEQKKHYSYDSFSKFSI